MYEMTDNYRSAKAVVDCANRYVQRIPGRLKQTSIMSATGEDGKVMTLKSLLNAEIKVEGNTAILTRTNEETMQVAYELEQRGLHATIAQSMGGFRFGNLAEVRYLCGMRLNSAHWKPMRQAHVSVLCSISFQTLR